MTTSINANHLTIGKVVCVGRNYAAHAKELGNEVPTQPILFIKPSSAVVSLNQPLTLPSFGGRCHYEAELCVQIGKDLVNATIEEVKTAIHGVTVGLDLTLREVQNELKAKGHPWERAKSFAGSCVLADWIAVDANVQGNINVQEASNVQQDSNAQQNANSNHTQFGDFTQVNYQFYLNEELRQKGDTSLMLFPIYQLLVEISQAFGLQAGDVVMTGTPQGVGELASGDNFKMVLAGNEWLGTVG